MWPLLATILSQYAAPLPKKLRFARATGFAEKFFIILAVDAGSNPSFAAL